MNRRDCRLLIRRIADGLYFHRDLNKLKEALSSPLGREDLSQTMDDVWEEVQANASVPMDKTELWDADRLLKKANKLSLLQRRLRWERVIMRYAAVLIIGIVGTYGAVFCYNYVKETNLTYIEVKSKAGECKQVILPDGSKVLLNAHSVLRYPKSFIAECRKVDILGEGFFDITPDKKHPFVVHTDQGQVQVLGTSFNVKSYREDRLFSVSVKTGKVQVNTNTTNMKLLPNDCLTLDKVNGDITKRVENVEKITSWMEGGLYFNNTPIKSVAAELSRRYGCRIELSSSCPAEETLFGEHDNKSLEAVLQSITYSTQIKYRKEKDGRIVLYKD